MNINNLIKVDEQNLYWLKKYRWFDNGHGYAHTMIKGKNVYFHRLIMKAKKGQEIDHINRNKLDNRKSNLRFSNRYEQMRNAIYKAGISGIVGVNPHGNHWTVRKRINGKKTHLGCFNDIEQARMAYVGV